jgi:uncharacterized protein YcfL
MRTRLLILAIPVMAMVSCGGNEGALSTGHDQRVVSGQVVMASSVPNASPAGIEVSVDGARMCIRARQQTDLTHPGSFPSLRAPLPIDR